jgi:hypothetical protein
MRGREGWISSWRGEFVILADRSGLRVKMREMMSGGSLFPFRKWRIKRS